MANLNFGTIDKFILFGGGAFLVKAAKKIVEQGYELIIFSAKRFLEEDINGKQLSDILREDNLTYHEPKDVNTDKVVLENISETAIGISMGAPWIFKENFIKRFEGKLLNMHCMRLPRNRGGGGYTWKILNKDKLGCSLLHKVDSGIDSGDIVKRKEFNYPESSKTPKDYIDYCHGQNAILFDEFLRDIKNKKDFVAIEQVESLSTYWPRLDSYKQGFLDWAWPLKDIESFINAFDKPYCGVSTFINNKRVFLKDCCVNYDDGSFHPFQTGLIYRKTEDALFVAAHEGILIVRKVYSEDKKDVLSTIKIGDRFFTPLKYLEEAKTSRAICTPEGFKED